MNINKKLIVPFVFFSIFILSILNIKNPEKTKFYLFTSKTEEISLGNLITITFIAGFSFSSVLSLISINNSQELMENNFTNYEEIDNRLRNEFPHKFEEQKSGSARRPAQTVAPASRNVKSGRKTVRLTQSQVAIAKKLGVPLEEYAKHVKEA